jgi:hypothetical protein
MFIKYMNINNLKTPLGYIEQAIAELRKTQDELQDELQEVRNFKEKYINLETQLKITQQELENTKLKLMNRIYKLNR